MLDETASRRASPWAVRGAARCAVRRTAGGGAGGGAGGAAGDISEVAAGECRKLLLDAAEVRGLRARRAVDFLGGDVEGWAACPAWQSLGSCLGQIWGCESACGNIESSREFPESRTRF
jgi:hypothetical protein